MLILIPLACIALVACALIFVATAGPEPPLTDNFKPTTAEAAAFDAQINSATNDAQWSGGFTLTFAERQISSWMALEGEAFAEEHDYSFPFENVQVGLEDGELTFYGELKRGAVKVPVAVIVEPQVDRVGHLDFKIKTVDVGGLRLPGALLDSVTGQLKDKIRKPLEDVPGDYILNPASLAVETGVFVVQGSVIR
jgi:uncharacterized protein YpmS